MFIVTIKILTDQLDGEFQVKVKEKLVLAKIS